MSNCPACATALPEGATTCSLCGFALAAAPTGAPRPPTRPSAPRPPGMAAPAPSAAITGSATRPGGFGPSAPGGSSLVTPPPPTPSAQLAPRPQPGEGPDPYIGRTIAAKFQVTELLGQGGMGKVYKARHLGLDKTVCVKTLKPALLEDATIVGRFEREAKAASRLNHSNSIQVLDFGQDEFGALYIAMEFVSGMDLRKTLRDEFPLGEERICHIMGQVLSALAEAHAQNVIHRDLKPENIMLEQRRGEPDYVKVLDFGIAKIQDPDVPGLTRADVVCGTPLYMSPEQATGSKFDARADLYSIGVILYQLTTGSLPFDGANSMEILTKHVTELPVPPRTRRPEVAISPEMEELILRALDKDPANRPASAEEFRADLLKIRDKLRRRREDAEEAAKAASTAHKQQRAQALKEKQAAQLASMGKPADSLAEVALPKSKTPLFVGLGVGVAALAGIAFVALRPSAPAPTPPVTTAPAATAPVAAKNPAGNPSVNPVANPASPSAPAAVDPSGVAPAAAAPTEPVAAVPAAPVPSPAAAALTAPSAPAPVETARIAPVVKANPVKAPTNPDEAPLKKGDTARARELVEEADLLREEEDFAGAVRLYRNAIDADPSFAKAYKGLASAGLASGDLKAQKAGLMGYLRAAPEAPDAAQYRRQLEKLR